MGLNIEWLLIEMELDAMSKYLNVVRDAFDTNIQNIIEFHESLTEKDFLAVATPEEEKILNNNDEEESLLNTDPEFIYQELYDNYTDDLLN